MVITQFRLSSRAHSKDPLEQLYRLRSAHRPGAKPWQPFHRWAALRTVIAFACLLALVAWMIERNLPLSHDANLMADMPRNGVVAGDFGTPGLGHGWMVTSGTLFMRDGMLWSGLPDPGPPSRATGRSGSSVLRAVSQRSNFGDVTIDVHIRLNGLTSSQAVPAHSWDGVHLFLHYHNEQNLYAVDLFRRDGNLTIKRKASPQSQPLTTPGTYTTLASTSVQQALGWHEFQASIADQGNGVLITLAMDGERIMTTFDRSAGPLTAPGRVGLRGDNAEFEIRRLNVRTD